MRVDKISKREEWERLQGYFTNGSFLQSWEWANFQEYALGKKVLRLAFFDKGDLVGITLAIEEVTRFGTFIYLPRGPIIDWEDGSWVVLLEAIVNYFKEIGYISVRIDPAIIDSEERAYVEKISSLGGRESKILMQVQRAWILDIGKASSGQDLFELARGQGMNKKLPGEIRRATKKGLEVKLSSDIDDVGIFYDLLVDLSERLGFLIRPRSYYEGQFKHLAPSGKERVVVAGYQGKPIAAALISYDNDEGSYLHAAALDEHRNLYAPSAVVWRAVEHAAQLGCRRFNFWGVISDERMGDPTDQGYGYSRFKRRFGGHVEEYIGTWDFVCRTIRYSLMSMQDFYRMKRSRQ